MQFFRFPQNLKFLNTFLVFLIIHSRFDLPRSGDFYTTTKLVNLQKQANLMSLLFYSNLITLKVLMNLLLYSHKTLSKYPKPTLNFLFITQFTRFDKRLVININPSLEKLYSYIKYHESENLIKPVPSYINNLTRNLFIKLNVLFKNITQFTPEQNIKNSLEKVNKLKHINTLSNSFIVSVDIKIFPLHINRRMSSAHFKKNHKLTTRNHIRINNCLL